MSAPRVVWEKNGSVLWCGDCREVVRELGEWDVTITDPPYEAEAHTSQRRIKAGTANGTRAVESAPLDFDPMTDFERAVIAAEIAFRTRRWALVFCQEEATHLWRTGLTIAGHHRYVRACCYVKEDPQPQLTGDRPGMGWECIVVTHPKGKPRWNGGGRCGIFSSLSGKSVDRRDGRGVHPAQKPTELMLELVELFTEPGELVFDGYAGSGTTGVACIRLGRRFIGVERDEKYAAIAAERLEAESKGLSLRDARAGQLSLLATP